MKLEKAIEILDNHQCDLPRNEVPDLVTAIKLGIEALKRIQDGRAKGYDFFAHNLPGETEE
jgi:hypothetical protein